MSHDKWIKKYPSSICFQPSWKFNLRLWKTNSLTMNACHIKNRYKPLKFTLPMVHLWPTHGNFHHEHVGHYLFHMHLQNTSGVSIELLYQLCKFLGKIFVKKIMSRKFIYRVSNGGLVSLSTSGYFCWDMRTEWCCRAAEGGWVLGLRCTTRGEKKRQKVVVVTETWRELIKNKAHFSGIIL